MKTKLQLCISAAFIFRHSPERRGLPTSDRFQYFFTYELDLPDEVEGFSLFGPWHIFWLVLNASLCLILCPVYRRMSEKRQQRFGLILCTAMLASEACDDIILLCLGEFDWQYLPLHLCGLAMFVCLAHALTHSDWSAQTLYCLCMPGAAAALIFPDWTRCPPLQYENLHGFIYHTLLILYPVLQLAAGQIRPQIRHIWKPALFLVCTVTPIYFLNHLWGTNFMFVNWPSEGSPLVAMERVMGNPGYLWGYGALVACIMVILYIPPTVRQAVMRRRSSKP